MENIEKELKTLVSRVIKVPEEKLDPNADMFKEYGVDSLLGVEIVAAIDKKYHVDVPEEKIRSVRTLNDMVALAKEVLQKGSKG